MSDDLFAYFGYGSLVNLETLQSGYVAAYPARLRGWKRHWQARPEPADPGKGRESRAWKERLSKTAVVHHLTPSQIALLSVHRHRQSVIGGMLVIDKLSALPTLDDRERLYDRISISLDDLELEGRGSALANLPSGRVFLYVGRKAERDAVFLLQSYLDAVMAGFLNAYGEAGLREFLQSTVGTDNPLIRDRENPVYPRAVKIDQSLAVRFDRMLIEAGVRF